MTQSSPKIEKTNHIIADRFQLQRLLAVKNSIETWEAMEVKNGQPILLKLLPSQVYAYRRYWSRMQQIFARTREWQHAGAVPFHLIEQAPDSVFFIGSQYLQGKTLQELFEKSCQNDNPQPLDLYLSVLSQTASTLDSAHAHQIGHFSLKPGNIFICTDGTIRITDFLVASEIRLALFNQMRLLDFNTEDFYYLAPEQLNGRIPTKASDLFSLASLVYHILTGMRTDYTMWKEFLSYHHSSPVAMKTIHKEIDAAQCEKVSLILSRGLSAAPENRFTNCRKFMDDILQCLRKHNSLLSSSELRRQCFSQDSMKNRSSVPIPNRDVPQIIINTTSPTDSSKQKLKNRSRRNWKSLAWLVNLFLVICICVIAYGKRELLMKLVSPNQSMDIEKPHKNPEPVFPQGPDMEETDQLPDTTSSNSPLEPVHYESLRQHNPPQPPDHEVVAVAPESAVTTEIPDSKAIPLPTVLPMVPKVLLDGIKSDAQVVYESGFTPTSWDIQESMIGPLAARQISTWQEGVEYDIPEACYLMAWCYRQGYGNVKKRNNTAFELFLNAAEKEFPPAQFDLAYHCYLSGIGTSKNKPKSNEWLDRAARNNETRALYFQAMELLEQGQATEASEILQKLSQKGFAPAKKRLETITVK